MEERRRTTGGARGVARMLADIAYPERCVGCEIPGTLLCDPCRARVPLIEHRHACPRCGAPDGDHGCAECGRATFAFEATRCAAVLEWPVSRAITLHKDAGELRLTRTLAELVAAAAGDWLPWADAVAFVPASPAALLRRGFDHGALLAAEVGRVGEVTAVELLRARPRRDQRALGRERRRANATGSIEVRAGVAVPARVLVIDDVMTTGATLDAAAAALLSAGARAVRCAAVARACGGRL